jgi:hypothetical protein
MKQRANTMDLHLSYGSTFSRKSWLTIVWNVLDKPAWIPFGGSVAFLMANYKRPRGKST